MNIEGERKTTFRKRKIGMDKNNPQNMLAVTLFNGTIGSRYQFLVGVKT